MNAYTYSLHIHAVPEKVFRAYVERINDWWPWKGKDFTYSFAPKSTAGKEIHFEPRLGGRYYERFADGTQYDIGKITVYEPPHKLAFTWRGPDWPGESLIEIEFAADGEHTTLTLTHSGFDIFKDQPEVAASYQQGSQEIMGIFTQWLAENLQEV